MINHTYSWFAKQRALTVSLLFALTFFHSNAHAGMMDEPTVGLVAFDKLEISDAEDTPVSWELDAWIKKGFQGVVFTSEGSLVNDENESENKLVYSHAIAPFWDAQIGLGYDTHEDESHTWGVIGISGMAPYFFEADFHALIDKDGTIGIRASAEKELLFTQRLILVPEIEAEAYSDDIPEMKHGSGLSSLALSMRLKYEFKREFAPYVGVEWHKKFGETADYSDEDLETSLVAGFSIWF